MTGFASAAGQAQRPYDYSALVDVDTEVSDEVTCLGVVLDSTLTFAANVKKRAGTVAFINSDNCVLFATLCPSTPQRPCSTPSSLLVSTTATAYCTASPPPIYVHFSQLSTRLHASSPVNASSTTSLTLCVTTCTMVTSPPTHPIQVVLVSQQVPAPYGAVVRGRHVHPSVGDIRSHSSAFYVPRTRMARYGPRGFAVSGPVTRNSLPPDLRDTSLSAASFFSQLETELFISAYYMTP